MRAIILLLIFISFNTQALVYGGYNQQKDCHYLSVHYIADNGKLTPSLPANAQQLYYTTILGNHREYEELATKNLTIDFNQRLAQVDIEFTVTLGANKTLNQRLFISADHPQFTRFINTLNAKLINISKDSIQYLCYRENGEIVKVRFTN